MEILRPIPEREHREEGSLFTIQMTVAEINIMTEEANRLSAQLAEQLEVWQPVLKKFLTCEQILELEERSAKKFLNWQQIEFLAINNEARIPEKEYLGYVEQVIQTLEMKKKILNLWVGCVEKLLWGFKGLISLEAPLCVAWYEAVSLYKASKRNADIQKVAIYYGFDDPTEPVITMKNRSFFKYMYDLFLKAYDLLSSSIIEKTVSEIKVEHGVELKNLYFDIWDAISKAANCRILCFEELPELNIVKTELFIPAHKIVL